MKFRVLRTFLGSQDGGTVTRFEAGSVVEISEHLAPHIAEWAVPADESRALENKAVITDGAAGRRPRLRTTTDKGA